MSAKKLTEMVERIDELLADDSSVDMREMLNKLRKIAVRPEPQSVLLDIVPNDAWLRLSSVAELSPYSMSHTNKILQKLVNSGFVEKSLINGKTPFKYRRVK